MGSAHNRHGRCPWLGTPKANGVRRYTRSMRPLFIPLRGVEFDAFARGEKSTEYRQFGRNFTLASAPPGRPVVLAYGYGWPRLSAIVADVEIVPARPGQGLDTYGPGATIIAIGFRDIAPLLRASAPMDGNCEVLPHKGDYRE
jgi:hypothetical protein